MKKVIGFTIVFMLNFYFVNAQSDKYVNAMKNALQEYGASTTAADLNNVELKFERIANAEKNQWLPFYYASQLKSRLSMQSNDEKKDILADQALALSQKADSLSPNNSEVLCIKSMANTAKMLVDPQSRFMSFGSKSQENLELAKKADANNPRPYVLEALSAKNKPAMFGGGCDAALPIAKKGKELFTKFVPSSEINPNWGNEQLDEILNSCK